MWAKLVKFIFILIGILIVLFGLLVYLKATYILESSAKIYASRAGLQNFRISVQQVGLNKMSIGHLGFDLPLESTEMHFEIPSVVINYDLTELFSFEPRLNVTAIFSDSSTLSVQTLNSGTFGLSTIDANLLSPLTLTYDSAESRFSTNHAALRTGKLSAFAKNHKLEASESVFKLGQLSWTPGQLLGFSDFSVEGIIFEPTSNLTIPKFKPAKLDGKVKSEGSTTTLSGSIAAGEVSLNFSIIFNQDSGEVEISFDLQPLTLSEKSPLNKKFDQWPYPLEVNSGKIRASGSYDSKVGQVKISAELEKLKGSMQQLGFFGLTGELEISPSGVALLKSRGPVHIDQLDYGIILKDTEFELIQPNQDLFVVSKLKSHLLGGSAEIPILKLDLNKFNSKFDVRINQIKLAEIFRLQGSKDIQGTGILNGSIPIILKNGVPTVNRAKVTALDPGGEIHYHTENSMTTGNLQLVYSALRDYIYKTLDITIDYGPDGKLRAAAAFTGHSPRLNKQQQVNVNINIEENIPALLKSLRLARGESFINRKR